MTIKLAADNKFEKKVEKVKVVRKSTARQAVIFNNIYYMSGVVYPHIPFPIS